VHNRHGEWPNESDTDVLHHRVNRSLCKRTFLCKINTQFNGITFI
jgi:hypothetical protein